MVTAIFGAGGDHEGGRDRELVGCGDRHEAVLLPLSALQAYRDEPSAVGARERNPVSYRLGAHGVNLPSALTLSRDDVRRVGEAVRALAAR